MEAEIIDLAEKRKTLDKKGTTSTASAVTPQEENQSFVPTPEDLFKRTEINQGIIYVAVEVLCLQISYSLAESMYEDNDTAHSSYVLDVENFETVYDVLFKAKGIPFVESIMHFDKMLETSIDLPLAMNQMLLNEIIITALEEFTSSCSADDLKHEMENPKNEGEYKFTRIEITVEGEMIQLIASIVLNDD